MRRILTLLLVAGGLMSVVVAQDTDEIADLSSKGARVVRGGAGRLTPPSNAGRPEIVSAFLATRRGQAAAESIVLETENATGQGPVHLKFRQRVAGFDVYGTYVKASMTRAGELLSVIENLVATGAPLLPASIDYRDALGAVLQRRYPGGPTDLPEVSSADNRVEFARGERFYQNPVVTRLAVPLANGRLRIGYLVETWDRENQLWHTVVNGNGRVLFEELRTATDRYNVFQIHPLATPQAVVDGPGGGNAESPAGWVANNTTIGNNVDAYLDRDNNNATDAAGRPVSSSQEFLQVFNLAADPTTTTNQMAAVANLFFLNNVIHDKLYRHGFTEAAGNFQTTNFGPGGVGNDPVNAEAQDGGGTNNANFATPNDGSRPRMQMYLWNRTSPFRDGDVDSDVVYHEYGHGLTWRMIGGMGRALSGAIGEGMSDTVALYMNGQDTVGEYSYNSSNGIRRHPYTNYPLTYGDVSGSSVHDNGEIYAATMWELRRLWAAAGLLPDSLWDRVIDGMNFTPSAPAYEDMRDGILAAINAKNASTRSTETCQVWTAFARFGIGEGASGTDRCGIFSCRVDTITESFVVPSGACSGTPPANTAPSVSITGPTATTFSQGASVTFIATASDAQDGDLADAIAWTSSLQGSLGSGGTITRSDLAVGTHVVTAAVVDSGGAPGSDTITITITAPSGGIELTNVTGYKVKGVRKADLTWSGATSLVDIRRDGAVVAAGTANDGFHTDTIPGKGGGSFTYQVCAAGSTTNCSNTFTVVF